MVIFFRASSIFHHILKVFFYNFQNQHSGSGFSEIDPNRINLFEHPNVANVPWTYATLLPGDCIYIPAGKAIRLDVKGYQLLQEV